MQAISNLLPKQKKYLGQTVTDENKPIISLTNKFKELSHEKKNFILEFWLRMGQLFRALWTKQEGLEPSDLWVQFLLKAGIFMATILCFHSTMQLLHVNSHTGITSGIQVIPKTFTIKDITFVQLCFQLFGEITMATLYRINFII